LFQAGFFIGKNMRVLTEKELQEALEGVSFLENAQNQSSNESVMVFVPLVPKIKGISSAKSSQTAENSL